MKKTKWLLNATFPMLLAALITVVCALFNVHAYLKEALTFILILFLVVSIWFYESYKEAKSKIKSGGMVISPKWLWTLIFNDIPKGKEDVDTNTVSIAVVYNSLSQVAGNILKKIKTANPYIHIHEVDLASDGITQELETEVVEGFYILYSKEVNDDKKALILINEWAKRNSDKPILYVDIHGKGNDLTYGKIAAAEGVKGFEKMLVRATKRAKGWRKIANANRMVASIAILLFILTLASLIVIRWYYKNENDYLSTSLKNENKILSDSLNIERMKITQLSSYEYNPELWVNYYKFSSQINIKWKNKSVNNLSNYFSPLLEATLNRLFQVHRIEEVNQSNYDISIFASRNDSIHKICCASKKEGSNRSFPFGRESVISAAQSIPLKFVLWKEGFEKGEPAIWDTRNKDSVLYRFSAKSDSVGKEVIKLQSSSSDDFVYGYKKFSGSRMQKGILAFVIKKNPDASDCNDFIGISVDVYDKGSVDFLSDVKTRKILMQAISIAYLIPD